MNTLYLFINWILNVKTLQELNKIYAALKTGLNSERKRCRKESSNCRITKEFPKKIENSSKFFNDMNKQLENIPLKVAKSMATQALQKMVIEPVNECLERSGSTQNSDLNNKVDEILSSSKNLRNRIDHILVKFGTELNARNFKSHILSSVMHDSEISRVQVFIET